VLDLEQALASWPEKQWTMRLVFLARARPLITYSSAACSAQKFGSVSSVGVVGKALFRDLTTSSWIGGCVAEEEWSMRAGRV
jgi:hypothetical protein